MSLVPRKTPTIFITDEGLPALLCLDTALARHYPTILSPLTPPVSPTSSFPSRRAHHRHGRCRVSTLRGRKVEPFGFTAHHPMHTRLRA